MEYKLITGTRKDLETKINELLNKNWKLYKGTFVHGYDKETRYSLTTSTTLYAQAMIRG